MPLLCGVLIVAAPVFRVLSVEHGGYSGVVLMPCRADALLLGVLCALLLRSERGRRAVDGARPLLYGVAAVLTAGLAVLCFSKTQRFEGGPYVSSFSPCSTPPFSSSP